MKFIPRHEGCGAGLPQFAAVPPSETCAEAHPQEENMTDDLQERRMLRRAYRVARREGYVLRKSRRFSPPQDYGELMLLDPSTNVPVVGWDFDASAEEVLVYLGVLEPPQVDETTDKSAADDSNGGEG
jgi:hypothetical protein